MHKPDPQLGPDQQDKRSVIPIERGDVDTWLLGSQEDARRLLQLAPADIFQATTASPAAQDAGSAPGNVVSPQQGSLL
jgi:putative SOS response-associated peptidase YedK